MDGAFLPDNRPLLIASPWLDTLADPEGHLVGWDGPVLSDGASLSTLGRGRIVEATVTEDTRRL